MRSALLTLLLTILLLSGTSPASSTPQDFGGWLNLSGLIPLEEDRRYLLYLELQPRVGDNWQRATTTIVRPALAYTATKSLSLYAGYAWTPTFIDVQYHRANRDVHLLWQQLIYTHNTWGLSWQHRLRQEQRKIEDADGISHRSGYRLKGSYALTPAQDFGLTDSLELQVNLNSTEGGPWAGYDRGRLFFGPYWKTANARYEIGYLGEHAKRFGNDERWLHAVAMAISMNF